jgi:hypothetical protein
MTIEYYSDKEKGPAPRSADTIPPQAWGGIVAFVTSLVGSGAFGEEFPEVCPDGSCVTGTDVQSFALAVQAEVPGIKWPLETSHWDGPSFDPQTVPFAPDTLDILDFVQFCYGHVSKPIPGDYHEFFKHHHLSFYQAGGREQFRQRINRILARNGVCFELQADGSVIRLAPPVLAEAIRSPLAPTGDATLDAMLEDARRKFLSPDPQLRRESLERLWDAWERLKSLDDPTDKKRSIDKLLDKAATEPKLRGCLEEEARQLTKIGNTFMIRHSEVGKVPIKENCHIDHLFHRMFSLIHLLLTARGK